MTREKYQFSGFILDAKRRELSREGREIELQPRVFNLLLFLLEHRERAVDKDELMDVVCLCFAGGRSLAGSGSR